jgi:serine O-acetyltransferase
VSTGTNGSDTPIRPLPLGLDLHAVVDELRAIRTVWRTSQQRSLDSGPREFPSREAVRGIVTKLCEGLFPMRLGPSDLRRESEDYFVGHCLYSALTSLGEQVRLELDYQQTDATRAVSAERASHIVRAFAHALPRIRLTLDTDVLAAYRGDPAARSVDEVLLCYPGTLATVHYRLAHELYSLGVPLLARMVTEIAHSDTGIDIHPGATIGQSLFIDHGTGVVIGETAVIGDRVRIYQAVTLGAKRFLHDEEGAVIRGRPRHPVVEDDVVIYAGATLLGRITIGRGSVIGGNVWLTQSVPPGSHVTQALSQHQQAGKQYEAGARSGNGSESDYHHKEEELRQ